MQDKLHTEQYICAPTTASSMGQGTASSWSGPLTVMTTLSHTLVARRRGQTSFRPCRQRPSTSWLRTWPKENWARSRQDCLLRLSHLLGKSYQKMINAGSSWVIIQSQILSSMWGFKIFVPQEEDKQHRRRRGGAGGGGRGGGGIAHIPSKCIKVYHFVSKC